MRKKLEQPLQGGPVQIIGLQALLSDYIGAGGSIFQK
jgi:hypothetical protein